MTGTWWSVLPPLLAIGIAMATRQVFIALFVGIWFGAFLVAGAGPMAAWTGLLDTIGVYMRDALADPDHAAILLLTSMIGGLVGIVSKSGGMRGVVALVTGWASTPKRGQLATSGLGLAVFFDDYANTLVVGNAMRAVTDRLRVSREKLAYLVDSTAAPVASVALVTTWIGFQVGLINEAVGKIDGYSEGAYSVFLNSLPYAFYPLLALVFVFAVAWSGRDFGPMLTAERRARDGGSPNEVASSTTASDAMTPSDDVVPRARNALIPIGTMVVVTIGGLWVTGSDAAGVDATLRDVIGEADSYSALMWGSMVGVVVAFVMAMAQRASPLAVIIEAWMAGFKSVLPAILVLVLAWSLSSVCTALDTGGFLTAALGDTLPAAWLPTIVFVLAAFTAFATGTSWGTMGILMPLVVPLAWAVSGGETGASVVLYASISAVLAGAVWGDHCSPLSDTTILSSMASGCDHIAHVRTQLPYALVVGGAAIALGLLPAGYGVPWWACLAVGAVVVVVVLRVFGRKVEA